MKALKKLILLAVLASMVYGLLSHHIIFFGYRVKTLKKATLTLDYTFFNVGDRSSEDILDIDALREDGIAELLVEMGRMSPEERDRLMAR